MKDKTSVKAWVEKGQFVTDSTFTSWLWEKAFRFLFLHLCRVIGFLLYRVHLCCVSSLISLVTYTPQRISLLHRFIVSCFLVLIIGCFPRVTPSPRCSQDWHSITPFTRARRLLFFYTVLQNKGLCLCKLIEFARTFGGPAIACAS